MQCWLNLATGKLKLGKYQACIKACDEAAALDFKYARTYRIRAEAHIGAAAASLAALISDLCR